MIRNILSIATVIIITALGVLLNLIILPLHNVGLIVWSKLVLFVLGVNLKITGREFLDSVKSGIMLINHESALDIPITLAAINKPSRFMAKLELFRVPFFGWVLKMCNHIPIDRQNRQKAIQAIDKVSAKLVKKNISIIVSPEGTRSATGKIGPFKKGAFHLAEKYNLPLVPVTIMGARYCLPNKSLKVIPGTVQVKIGKPVFISQFGSIDACIRQVRDGMVALKEKYERHRSESA